MRYLEHMCLTNRDTGEIISGIYVGEDEYDVHIRITVDTKRDTLYLAKSKWRLSTQWEQQKSKHEAQIMSDERISEEGKVVCPYCYESIELDGEDFGSSDYFKEERYCEDCENNFMVEANVDFRFFSKTSRIIR